MVLQDQIPPPGDVHYLPHRTVVRLDRDTTKVRVVYDASSKVFGPSFNDCLHIGPSLNPLLFDILLRFRVHEVSLTADIEKAFFNIEMFSNDFEKSNGPRVDEEDESSSKTVFKQSTEKEQKVLGMLWNPTQDELIYDLNKTLGDVVAQLATRRLILSTTTRFFDSLRLIASVILPFNMMFQELCKA